jgi:Tol biopolymer transport system component
MLAAGMKLGPYEIVGPLGAGGMGEVYRARDTRLGRDVAVKVLPEHLSTSPDLRARFEREARTLSSLNHGHICVLHDVGREGDTDYLVMELVDGETLADRIARGALPLDQVLKLGSEIADALERAHRAGIVHRDLKPENVMLTKSGAKLMDFGLARGATPGAAPSDLSQSPTMTRPLTQEGHIVGTFQYMAPEQLAGGEADARSDLWALGCVLYEMATGRKAFEGKSQASLIGVIMNAQPLPMSGLAPMAPPALERVVDACLAKDPGERIQTAHDVRLQLRWIAEGGSQAGLPAPVVARRKGRERLAWIIAAAGLALGAVAAPAWFAGFAPVRPVQLSLLVPEGQVLTPYSSDTAISPDGRTVAFAAYDSNGVPHLWLHSLEAQAATLLPGTENAFMPFWSPDSRVIAFASPSEHKLKKVPISGGTPLTVCDAENFRGGSWGRNGEILFAPASEGPLYRVSAGGGEAIQVTTVDSVRHENGHRMPCFLPDGEHFLFASLPAGPQGFDIYTGSLRSKSVKKVMTARSAPAYVSPGCLVFVREGSILAQRFDAGRLELRGEAVTIGEAPVASELNADRVASGSRDGRLVFPIARRPDTHLVWLDRTGVPSGEVALPRGPWGALTLSPDARRAALVNGNDIWIADLTRMVTTRVTSGKAVNTTPIWSPDGAHIAFVSTQIGREEIYVVNADASGDPVRTRTTDDQFKLPYDWSRSGETLVFGSLSPTTHWDIWTVPMSGDGKPSAYLRSPSVEQGGRISPDGKWLAYQSDESGTIEVYAQSFPVPGHKVQISTGGGQYPAWTRDGRELVYYSGDFSAAISVPLEIGPEIRPGAPRTLFKFPRGYTGADVARDGERFLVSVPTGEGAPARLNVVLGWTGLIER